MILIPHITGKRYGVVGLGKSGRATVASLLASGAEVFAWDDKEAPRAAVQQEFAAVRMMPVDAWPYATMAAVVMSPGIVLNHPAVLAARAHGAEVIGDVELLSRAQPDARYVGITGTNGKSTTTTLIAHILQSCGKRVEVGGNLGTPALALAPLGPEGIYVLEMSSYQLDLIEDAVFHVAVWLNISPDHLDHHGSMENYVAAKNRIFDNLGKNDTAIIGIDDAYSEAIARQRIARQWGRVVPISVKEKVTQGVYVADGILHNALTERQHTADIGSITSLQGAHNWQNAAAAYAACRTLGCAHDAIVTAMHTYPGLAHRMQWLGVHAGIRFVNDSKATNADAAEKALLTYDNIYWIIGGVAKEGGIEPLARFFPKIRHAYLIGEAAQAFALTLQGQVPYTVCGTLEKAFAAATYGAKNSVQTPAAETPVVLLSPACASFDQFANFEVRGEAFMRLVSQFAAEDTHATTA